MSYKYSNGRLNETVRGIVCPFFSAFLFFYTLHLTPVVNSVFWSDGASCMFGTHGGFP